MPIKETIEGIELTAPSKWDRDTIADGAWLRDNSINPLYENEKILASAIANSASRVYWSDETEKKVRDIEFKQGPGSSYEASFEENGSQDPMVIPSFNSASHEHDNDLWFGWNSTDGFDFYDAQRIISGVSEAVYVNTDVTLSKLKELQNTGKRIILRNSSTDYPLLYTTNELSEFVFGIPTFEKYESSMTWFPDGNYYGFEIYKVNSSGCHRITNSERIDSDHLVPTLSTVLNYTSAYRAEVIGTNFIGVSKERGQYGQFIYGVSLVPSKLRSWHDGSTDVGNIKIEVRNGCLEFSAGAPAQGGGHDDVWEYENSEWKAKKLGVRDWSSDSSAAFVCVEEQDAELPTDLSSCEYVMPKRITDTNDDKVFGKISHGHYDWFDVSAVSRVSIGTPAYDDNILTII